jgi:hypothetical protein
MKCKFVLLLGLLYCSAPSGDAQTTKLNLSNQVKGPAVINQEVDGATLLSGKRATDTNCAGHFIEFFKADGTTPLYTTDCEGNVTIGDTTVSGFLAIGGTSSTFGGQFHLFGGDAASNGEAPYFRGIPSPVASGDDSYLFPCSTGGEFGISTTAPSADCTTAQTIERIGHKDAASGYAGLTSGTKLNAAHGQEVWAVTDLTSYATTSGTGTQAILATITTPSTNDVMTWSGSNWINQASGGANHNFLSATHPDTTPGSVVRGDMIIGYGATPTWTRLLKGTQYQLLTGGATEPNWGAVALDQSTAVSGILGSANGGTGNGFTKFTGPTTSERVFTLPDVAAATIEVQANKNVASGYAGLTASSTLAPAQVALTTRGDLLTVNSTPALIRLGISTTANTYVKTNATDLLFSTLPAAGTGACAANSWASTLNADAAPTCTQPAVADLSDAANVVKKDAANTWSTGAQSMAAATSFVIPVSAGYAPTANGTFGFDSTEAIYVGGIAGTTTAKFLYGVDPLPSTGNCLKYGSAGKVEDAGIACEGLSPYEATFSAQTTVTVTAATHGFASRQMSVVCFDNSSPNKQFEPNTFTVDASTFEVVLTFNPAATGHCSLFGTIGTTIAAHNLLGSSHDANAVSAQTGDLMYRTGGLWDRKAMGAALQVLRVNAGATALEYADPAGGTSVNVNGASVSNPNFNGTTPAAETNYVNVKYQVATSDVSAEFPIGAMPAGTAVGTSDTGTPKITFVANGMTMTGGSGTGLVNLTNGAMGIEIANASPGTSANKLAKLNGAPSQATITGAGDTSDAEGVVVSGAGTTGNAVIARVGIASLVFDAATTAGHYVQQSASVAGDGTDAGATCPTSGQVIGRVLSTNGGAGTYAVLLFGTGARCGGGGGGISTLNTLTAAVQTFATPGTTGTAPSWSSVTDAHTLNIPMAATASVTAGLVSKTQYDSFALTTTPAAAGTAPNWASNVLNIPLAATASVTAGLISKTQYDTFDAKASLVAVGTNGIAAYNAGDDTTAARSDHTHRVPVSLSWFFPGTVVAGVQTARTLVHEGATNCLLTNSRISANTTGSTASTWNIARCTTAAGDCTASTNIYSSAVTLNSATQSVAGGTPNVTTITAGDAFKVNLVTVGTGLGDVTVALSCKCETTN